MAPKPKSKITMSQQFTNTYIDYYGPLYVKDGTNQKKESVCLFICIAVSIVHLELMEEFAEHFLGGLRRFKTRREKPDEIISDNVTLFKVGKKTIDMAWNDIINDPQVHCHLSEKRIKWSFMIELSRWI